MGGFAGLTWGRVSRLVGKPQGDPAWTVWCCIPGGTMIMKLSALRFFNGILVTMMRQKC